MAIYSGTHVADRVSMDGSKSLRFLGLAGGALVLGVLAACAVPATDGAKGTRSAVTQRTFDRNTVLDDKSMRDSTAMTAGDVQKFLDKTPWGTKSALAVYKENGKSAAQIIVETATVHGINPIEMLVRVQMEEGLISKTTASSATIAIAFACGCPSSAACSDKYRGFANQAECAAGTLRRSMDKALTSQGTASGWARSKSKVTEDGITIVPTNATTAALYTYTPYVGKAGGGQENVGGVSLHAEVWDRFAEFASYGAWAVKTDPTTEEDDGGADAADPTPTPAPTPAPTPDPTSDAGTTADSGSHADGGGTSGSKGAPEDGSDDGKILGQGNAPPASDAPPPRSKASTPSKPSELPTASDAELAGKPKDSAGCSTTNQSGGGGGMLLAAAVAVSLIASRRRRRS